ncbi:MAG TPA: hypothetical protein GYA08_05080 [Chloroflexi bacterium]|nr:hypothetical protein [Chloroflexota bacterium]
MTNGTVDLRSKPVADIEGYRTLLNRSYQPFFQVDLPANWLLEEHRLETKQGEWISIVGPVNTSKSRNSALDIYIFKESDRTRSISDIVEQSIADEGIGDYQINTRQAASVSDQQGQEVQLTFTTYYRTESGLAEVTIVKKWVTLMHGDYVVQIFYEAPIEDFDRYLNAYEIAKQTFTFIE